MTSIATDKDTRAYFQAHDFFSLGRENVVFFTQGELPALTMDGKIILEGKFKVALSPNGNGGLYEGLRKHGILDDMARRGVELVHAYGVDNALVRTGDPRLLGFVAQSQADCVNKVVIKENPLERVGVMARKDDRVEVVEYSEIPADIRDLRDASGMLVYSAANIAQHAFTTAFLRECVSKPLP